MPQHAGCHKSVSDRRRSLGSNLVIVTRRWALQDVPTLAWTANPDAIGFTLHRSYSGIGRASGSADRGLIDRNQLRIPCDNTILPSAASHFGRRVCDGPSVAPRFRDGEVSWGGDSSNRVRIYGHRFCEITAVGCAHDVPIPIRSVGANRHDPDAPIFVAIPDSAHGAWVLFDPLYRPSIQAIIALNSKHNPEHPLQTISDGLPLRS